MKKYIPLLIVSAMLLLYDKLVQIDSFVLSKPPIEESLTPPDRTLCLDLGTGSPELATCDNIEFDSTENSYFIKLTPAEQRRYRDEDQPFAILVPKKPYGGTVKITDTASTTYVSLPGIVTERYLVGNYH
jgi:hypothetical protein